MSRVKDLEEIIKDSGILIHVEQDSRDPVNCRIVRVFP